MPRYPEERKQAVLAKMAPPNNMTVPDLANAEGISQATLYNWRKQARQIGAILPSYSATPNHWSSQEKFQAVIQTAAMSEAELGEYCRKHGLYAEQIEAWKAACIAGNDQADAQGSQHGQALKRERKKSKQLAGELKRKDAALAETAALLTLSKKAEAIWGPSDEDA